MKLSKLRALLMVGLMSMSAMLVAQPNEQDMQQLLQDRIEQTKVRLQLSDEQVEQISPIITEYSKDAGALLKKYGLSRESKPEEKPGIMELRKLAGEMNKLQTILIDDLSIYLNDQQLQEYQNILDERKEKIREQIRQRR